MIAIGDSPHFLLFILITIASETFLWANNILSISAGYIFSPPDFIKYFFLSTKSKDPFICLHA